MLTDGSCLVCHGKGVLLADVCPLCDGDGFLDFEDPIHSHRERNLASSASQDSHKELWNTFPSECSNPILHLDYEHDWMRFQQECIMQSRPAVIHGVVSSEKWLAASRWSDLRALAECYGHLIFTLKPGLHVRLESYLQYASSNKADFPYYLSDRGTFAGHEALLDDFSTPAWFKDDVYDMLDMAGQFRYFICGGQRTGTNIHVDPLGTCAWNTSLYGHKRWVFLPPGKSEHYKELLGTDAEYNTLPPAYWFIDVYPELKRNEAQLGMIECIQGPGETIFVPAGWWHIVLNLDTTVAVTRNHMLPMMLPSALKCFDDESPAFARMLRQQLSKLTGSHRQLVKDALGHDI